MTFALRPYQVQIIDEARQALRTSDTVVIQLPTGGGKTGIAAHILHAVTQKNKTAYFFCHRRELIEQSARTFTDFGIPFGIISAGYTPDRYAPVQLCSVDTVKARLSRGIKLPIPSLVALDECHHVSSAGWSRLVNSFPGAKVIGLTATPERLDGKGLKPPFTSMVLGPTMRDLIDDGYLCPLVVYAPTHDPDLSAVDTVGGDFHRAQLAAAMGKTVLIGDAVEHYRSLCHKQPAIVFGVDRAHAAKSAEHFSAAYRSLMVDGTTDRRIRKDAVVALGDGRLDVLTSCDIFGEGVDVPRCSVAIMLRPTKSLPLYLQWAGRVTRPIYAPGFDLSTRAGRLAAIAAGPKPRAYILDHAGNCRVHGLPDDPREWSLEGRRARQKKAAAAPVTNAVRQCPKCYAMNPATVKACGACGFAFPVTPRTVHEFDGKLHEVKSGGARVMPVTSDPVLQMIQKMDYGHRLAWARTLDQLKIVAQACGYSQKWAYYNFQRRKKRA